MRACLARWMVGFVGAVWAFGAFASAAAWPDRSLTLIVGWPRGSGSDQVARELAVGLGQELGVHINVLNLEGANGLFAHTAVAYANPDGYTLGLVTPEVLGAYWMRQAEYGVDQFTPLVMVEQSPAVFWVARNSPWRTMKEAMAALRKAPPGTYRVGGLAEGGAYHIALADLMKAAGLPVGALQMLPGEGGADCIAALEAKKLEICVDSLRESGVAWQSGKVRALGVFSQAALPALRGVPTMHEALGREVPGGIWRVLMAPKGLPPEVRTRLEAAASKVVESVPFNQFETIHDLGVPPHLAGQALEDHVMAEQQRWGEVLRDLGLRKRR
jgi:tripartite-type tricarboxylate transporter receptor subunit TctC